MRLTDLEDWEFWEWPDGAVDLVAEALEGADAGERAVAVGLAGHCYAEDRVARALIRLVQRADVDGDVRARAAVALGPMLESCDMETNDWEDEISPDTFRQACAALQGAYLDERNPEILRRRAVEAAARAWRPWLDAAVPQLAKSPSAAWRMTGVFAAGHHTGHAKLAAAALDDADPEVVAEAVRAVGGSGSKSHLDRIAKMLRSPKTNRDVRIACLWALSDMGSRGKRVLERFADETDDDELAEEAREALEEALDLDFEE